MHVHINVEPLYNEASIRITIYGEAQQAFDLSANEVADLMYVLYANLCRASGMLIRSETLAVIEDLRKAPT